MQASFKRLSLILTGLILIAGIIPVFHFWYYVGRMPGMTPVEAGEFLSTHDDSILVDVRTADKFAQLHLENAQNWPYSEIKKNGSSDDLPQFVRGKTVLLICDGGVLSASATQLLRKRFDIEAYSVEGGMQAWIAQVGKSDGITTRFIGFSGEFTSAPFKESPWYEQIALIIAVGVIKPLYMLIALILIILLWKLKSPDGLALRWGLTFFLAGETACAVNIIFFSHGSYLLEFFHMYGMVLSFAFFFYAVIEMLDTRMIAYSDPDKKCAMLSNCRQCIKYGAGVCGLRRMFYFLMPSLILLSFIPLIVHFNALSYNTKIFGMLLNLSHPIIFQFFEIRYAPIYSIVLIGASLLVFIITRSDNLIFLKILLSAGIGPLAFSFLRLVFFSAYHDNLVWANSWEELTELIYTSGVAYTIWLFQPGIFGLGIKKAGP